MKSDELRAWLTGPDGLATRLRELRGAAGFGAYGQQKVFAERLGWDATKVTKIERGNILPSDSDIREWVAACGTEDAADELIALREQGHLKHESWRQRTGTMGHAAVQKDWKTMVEEAKVIRDFQMTAVPGFFQTYNYALARATEVARFYGGSEEGIPAAVEARMRRAEVLYRGTNHFHIVLMESGLKLGLAEPDVMAEQIAHLLTLSRLPRITIGIIPERVRLPYTPKHSFILLDNTAYIEGHAGLDTIDGPPAERLALAHEALMAEAVTGEKAESILRSLITWWQLET